MTGRNRDGAGDDDGLGRDPANDAFFENGGEGRGRVEWREGPVLPGARSDREADDLRETYANDEPEQLTLGTTDDDVRLPWLESADDNQEDVGSNGQTMGLIALGLLALALLVGAIWWLTRGGGDVPVADGSVIEAPEGPYKERPKDPGGKTFDGTGDTSFAVSEGQNRPARLGQSGPAPAPGFTSVPKAGASAAAAAGALPAAKGAAAAPGATAIDTTGVGVQVGAFSTRAAAEAAWGKLAQRHSALSGLRHRVIEGKADIGTVHRLQAIAADAATARTLCAGLQRDGLRCQVK